METVGVNDVDFTHLSLSPYLIGRVVDHYLGDYQILRLRYGIRDHIQLHRVAGLLASAICRFRPIVVSSLKPTAQEAAINEHYALHVSLSICAEHYANGDKDVFAGRPLLVGWAKRFKYLLGSRNYTAESLAMVFETLCIDCCPDNFKRDPAYNVV